MCVPRQLSDVSVSVAMRAYYEIFRDTYEVGETVVVDVRRVRAPGRGSSLPGGVCSLGIFLLQTPATVSSSVDEFIENNIVNIIHY